MNKTVPLRGFGGGGVMLNFKVVKNPQPANPAPNTIWVNTDHKITGYNFSAEQPENMAEGEVWFGVGDSSHVAFSATKKNSIMIYPVFAKQLIAGALIKQETKIWQNGRWVDWVISIVSDGEIVAPYSTLGSPTVEGDVFSYKSGSKGDTAIIWQVDLTQFNTIHFDINIAGIGTANHLWVGVYEYIDTPILEKDYLYYSGDVIPTNDEEFDLDVSTVQGTRLVLLNVASGAGGKAGSVKMNSIYYW